MDARRVRITAASVFAVAFLAYVLVFDRNFDTPDQIADWLDNNLALQYAGSIAVAIAGVAFLVLMSNVRVLVAATAHASASLGLMFGASVLFVGLLWVATPIDVGVAEYVGSDIDVTTYEAISNIAHQHLLYSQIAVAVSLGVLFTVARRSQWPGWVIWFTGLVVITSIVQLLIPILIVLLPVWAVVLALGADVGAPESQLGDA